MNIVKKDQGITQRTLFDMFDLSINIQLHYIFGCPQEFNYVIILSRTVPLRTSDTDLASHRNFRVGRGGE